MEEGKIIRRTTTFRFQSKVEMVNAFKEVSGIGIRRLTYETHYQWGKFKELYRDSIAILEYFGKKPEKVFCWYPVTGGHGINCDIKEHFKLPYDTEFDWWDRTVTLTTYNLSEDQHKTEMRKVYYPMIRAGYELNHECQTVVTNANC